MTEDSLCLLTVLSQHHHDLRVCELSFFDLQRELAHRLLHFWILNTDQTGAGPTSTHLFIAEHM